MQNIPKTIGIVCTGDYGHVLPCLSIARELDKQGYKIVFYQNEDGQKLIGDHGFHCSVYGKLDLPLGTWAEYQEKMGLLSGYKASKYAAQINLKRIRAGMNEMPSLFLSDALDFLLIDQVAIEAATAAEYLKIPYILLMNSLQLNVDPNYPPFFSSIRYSDSRFYKIRYRIKSWFHEAGLNQLLEPVNKFRISKGLPPETARNFGLSKIGQICQLSPSLDFPRTEPDKYRRFYCGLISDNQNNLVEFPYHLLSNKKIVYCSFGTLQAASLEKYKTVIKACEELDVQLVVSLGIKDSNVKIDFEIPSNVILVNYAPQYELLKKSHLFISHCGLGGTMQSLKLGVPILCAPITTDQPGVAARVERSGAGMILKTLKPREVRRCIKEMLLNDRFRMAAEKISAEISDLGGAKRAAELINKQIGSTVT